MNGETAYTPRGLAPDKYTIDLSFGGNDVGAPVTVRSERGLPAGVAVTRTGVGTYRITFGAGMTLPNAPFAIHATAEPVNTAGGFVVFPIAGNTLTTTRILDVQCVDFAGAAVELPAAGTSRVNVSIAFTNNTGR